MSPTAVLKSAPFEVDVIGKLSLLESSINLVQPSICTKTSKLETNLNLKYSELLKLIKDLYRDCSLKDEENFVTENMLRSKIDHVFELLLKKKFPKEIDSDESHDAAVISPITITKLQTDIMTKFDEAKKEREDIKNEIIKFIEERFALISSVQDKILSFIKWLQANLIYLLILSVVTILIYFGIASLVLQGGSLMLAIMKWIHDDAVDGD